MNCIISGRYLESSHGEIHASVSLNLLEYFRGLGFNSRPIWSESFPDLSDGELENVSLIVLTGGESIGESDKRDAFERRLLEAALSSKTPVMGICRGLQVMLSFYGAAPIEINDHAGTNHLVAGQISGYVNSFHYFGFRSVPKGFDVISSAPDGSVEAAYHERNNWLGIMWHPEREAPINKEHTEQILQFLGLK